MAKNRGGSRFDHLPLSTAGPIECALTGAALLRSPMFNKGSAFTPQERAEFELDGLLPSNVQTLEEQVQRAYEQYRTRRSALGRNTFMTSMMDQNEVLFYRLLLNNLKEMFSIIYTPTEGDAIQNYSRLFRRPTGCYIDIDHSDNVDKILQKWGGADDIDLIVVSDGEQILGIGDQGVGGVLISVAKLVIYTACAGIHPHRTLPVILDCGTNNKDLLDDDLYLGLRKPRVRGEAYDVLIEKFINAARKQFPKAYLHCEDFGISNARRILDQYRPRIPIFNDDVQGTGCVTLAAITAALHVSQVAWNELRIVCFGAGTAGTGIADQIASAISLDIKKSLEEARKQIWCVDKFGLLLTSQGDRLTHAQQLYARDNNGWSSESENDLMSVVRKVKPHVLIGTSTKPGAFTEEIVREMASHVDRPIIFPLSNPTRLCEADPKDINSWTEGRALIATGSPFPPVEHDGVEYEVAECNNSTIFPAIGLGVVLSRAKLVSDKMLVAATNALAKQAPALKDANKGLLPDVVNVREISVHIAKAVIQQAVEEGLNEEKNIPDETDVEEWISAQMWDARYRPMTRVAKEDASRHARGELGMQGTKSG